MTLETDIRDAIGKTEISMWKRLLIRSVILLLLTAVAMVGLDLLVIAGRERVLDINERWPEIINILRAGFIMTWMEVGVLWLRTAIAPKVDVQVVMNKAAETSMGAAVVSIVHFAMWALRITVFLQLSGLAK